LVVVAVQPLLVVPLQVPPVQVVLPEQVWQAPPALPQAAVVVPG